MITKRARREVREGEEEGEEGGREDVHGSLVETQRRRTEQGEAEEEEGGGAPCGWEVDGDQTFDGSGGPFPNPPSLPPSLLTSSTTSLTATLSLMSPAPASRHLNIGPYPP